MQMIVHLHDDLHLYYQLVQHPDTALLGVILLHTVSEELAAPREDLSMARREELHRLLLAQVPIILHHLNSTCTFYGCYVYCCRLFLMFLHQS